MQAEYVWNSNKLTLTAVSFDNGVQQGYEETRSSSQDAFIADFLVYFRKRDSRLRPFLAVGTGFVHFSSTQQQIKQSLGGATLPPQNFTSTKAVLHVPVGLDVRLTDRWRFRYTFSETLSANPISAQLSPPGQDRLKNFQNLFGFLWQF